MVAHLDTCSVSCSSALPALSLAMPSFITACYYVLSDLMCCHTVGAQSQLSSSLICTKRPIVTIQPNNSTLNKAFLQVQLSSACTAQHSTAQHSTAQHSTARHGTAQHSTALHSTAQVACHNVADSCMLTFLLHCTYC